MTIQLGTEIYYTGDVANDSGYFKTTFVSEGLVKLKEIDGARSFSLYPSQIGDIYRGHCNPRFVTKEAVQNFRKAKSS
jgi:hypothetical protein